MAATRFRAVLGGPAGVVIAVMLGAAALMSVCFIVGHPDVFPDTAAYALVGQWFAEQAGFHPRDGLGLIHHRADLSMFFTMAGARSPVYGLLLFLTTIRGSAWAIVSLQALVASALLALALRAVLGVFRAWQFALTIGVLTLVSSLPFFVAFVMPDVWLGLGALSAILLLLWFDRLKAVERWAVGVVLFAALTFHATNPPDILVLALIAIAALAVRAAPVRSVLQGLAVVAAGLAVSVIAAGAYPWSVQQLAHRELARPPFLAARVLADGPGRVYLRRACAQGVHWALCRFADRPLTDANDILWATSRRLGVFEPADYATRMAIVHEEGRFVAASVASAPFQSVARLAMDSLNELTYVSVVDTLGYSDRNLVARGPRFTPLFGTVRFCVRHPFYCNSTPAQLVSEDLLQVALLVSAVYLALRLALGATRRRAWGLGAPISPRLSVAIVGVIALLLVNALICGSLSGVYPRYQMRITWLLPLFALLAALEPAALARRAVEASLGRLQGAPGDVPTSPGAPPAISAESLARATEPA